MNEDMVFFLSLVAFVAAVLGAGIIVGFFWGNSLGRQSIRKEIMTGWKPVEESSAHL